MLVLTRKSGQTIHIGDVIVRVVETRSGRCRIAIEAPREVLIRRGELEDKERGRENAA